MEVAASLRERGLHVTVIAQESVPFEKQLGPEIGGAFVGLHEQHGVSFRMNTEVAALTGPSSGERSRGVRTANTNATSRVYASAAAKWCRPTSS